MASLTSEQKEFFAAMESTFDTQGWTLLSNGWREEQEQLPQRMFFGAKTPEDLLTARVRYGLLNELLALPQSIADQKTAALTGDLDDDV